jgi:hypothetical protein
MRGAAGDQLPPTRRRSGSSSHSSVQRWPVGHTGKLQKERWRDAGRGLGRNGRLALASFLTREPPTPFAPGSAGPPVPKVLVSYSTVFRPDWPPVPPVQYPVLIFALTPVGHFRARIPHMSLKAYFDRRIELMAPAETITLTRESLEWIVAQHGDECACASQPAVAAVGAGETVQTIFTVSELALEFRASESSMRAFVAGGLFGPATALRRDREGKRKMPFRIPSRLVEAVREMLESGHLLGSFCVVPAALDSPVDENVPSEPNAISARVVSTPDIGNGPNVTRTAPTAPSARPPQQPKTKETHPQIAPHAPARQRRDLGETDLSGWRKHRKQGG